MMCMKNGLLTKKGFRKAVGLLDESPENSALSVSTSSNKEVSCGICFDSYAINSLRSASATCPHLFCEGCWIAYIRTSINDGPGCLMMRCPDPSCGVSVSQGMIHTLLSEGEQRKYQRYLIRSYVESSPNIKWCPGPGCDCAMEYVVGSGGSGCDVICSCSYTFCWNCMEDAHRPVDCETVAKWIFKNSSESENATWILVNSKPCPKCKRPIEKNEGCMHMTCRPPCCFEFCWVCLGPWSKHDRMPCNVYKAAKKDGGSDEAERIRKMAKKALDRYLHYYERWASNHKSRQNALSDLHKMRIVHLEMLCEKQCQPESQMKFIVEAWQQIVECRRVLKWTYAYGYYLPQHEETKKQLFEYLQGQAEAGLERLHGCVEKEFSKYRDDVDPSEDFNEFRKKLVGLTSVTRNYFDNLVRALENGLSDVEANKTIPKEKPAWETEGILQDGQSQRANTRGKEIGSSSTNSGDDSGDDEWACDRCTYINVGYANTCVMCHE